MLSKSWNTFLSQKDLQYEYPPPLSSTNKSIYLIEPQHKARHVEYNKYEHLQFFLYVAVWFWIIKIPLPFLVMHHRIRCQRGGWFGRKSEITFKIRPAFAVTSFLLCASKKIVLYESKKLILPRPSLSLPGDTPLSLNFQPENTYLIRISAYISENTYLIYLIYL